jgi:hypothetical protein|tara:strand:- start:258 stop:914 length:657 start_codon:yes stop_codon:yes gene_type:complete
MEEKNEEQPQTAPEVEAPVEGEETEEAAPMPEEQPKEEVEKDDDFHTPEDKPKRTEKEKLTHTLKSVGERARELGVDPVEILGGTPEPSDETQFVTKRQYAHDEARKMARSEAELDAIMKWYDKGLSVEESHYMANKGRVKETFAEVERGNVNLKEATGAGQKASSAPESPEPDPNLIFEWSKAKMVWDPKTKTAKGKFNEAYWNAEESRWDSRRISA